MTEAVRCAHKIIKHFADEAFTLTGRALRPDASAADKEMIFRTLQLSAALAQAAVEFTRNPSQVSRLRFEVLILKVQSARNALAGRRAVPDYVYIYHTPTPLLSLAKKPKAALTLVK